MANIYRLLHTVNSITQKFLGRAVHIIQATDEVNTCITDLEHLHESIEDEFLII